MEVREVQAIVERHIESLTGSIGIAHWRIRILYDLRTQEPNGTALGQCDRLYDYNQATISLDPGSLEDEEHVLKILRHELFHVLLSPYDMHANITDDLTKGNAKLHGMAARVWRHCQEKAVINLERMYQGLTANPKGKPRMGRQRPVKPEDAETKPKARPKGKAKKQGKTPAR